MHVGIQLRWSDLDAQGHVNNARVADYLQEARVHLVADSGLLEHGVVVVGHQVIYRKPIEYSAEPLDVELGVTLMGAAKLEVGYELRQRDEVVAEARSQLAAFDFGEQRPRRLSPTMRAHFEQHRVGWGAFPELAAPAIGRRGLRTLHQTRWSDLDRYGHVNNVLAFEYLQQARVEVSPQWEPTMARTGSGDARHVWLVVRQDVDYLAQIQHSFAPLEVFTAPVRVGTSSITSVGEVYAPTGELLARGRTVVVCADRQLKPTPVPNRARIEQFLV